MSFNHAAPGEVRLEARGPAVAGPGRARRAREAASGGRSTPGRRHQEAGRGLRRLASAHRRVREVPEDPLHTHDTLRLLRRLGVLLADFRHPGARGALVPGARAPGPARGKEVGGAKKL